MCPSPPPPFPKDTTPSGVKGKPSWEGASSISIAMETTQGMTLLCDSVDTECCYQDIQWNKPKCHAYTQEKKKYIKGNSLLKAIYINIYIYYIWQKTKHLSNFTMMVTNYFNEIISFIYFSSVCSSLSWLSKPYRNLPSVLALFLTVKVQLTFWFEQRLSNHSLVLMEGWTGIENWPYQCEYECRVCGCMEHGNVCTHSQSCKWYKYAGCCCYTVPLQMGNPKLPKNIDKVQQD